MKEIARAYAYYLRHQREFWMAMTTHLQLSFAAVGIALLVCVPLGIWAARKRWAAGPVINTANALRVIPSLALLFIVQPYLGIGFKSALVALTVLACPPILINTYAAYRGVDRSVIEAAYGMGMSGAQVLRSIETPLAMPVVLAGLRIAVLEVIASASLAAFIGAGGLGNFIQRGFAVLETSTMLVGVIPIAVLALLAEALLAGAQRAVTIRDA